jgi:hypothetical protein
VPTWASWVYRRRPTGRLWNTTSCLTVAPLTHSHTNPKASGGYHSFAVPVTRFPRTFADAPGGHPTPHPTRRLYSTQSFCSCADEGFHPTGGDVQAHDPLARRLYRRCVTPHTVHASYGVLRGLASLWQCRHAETFVLMVAACVCVCCVHSCAIIGSSGVLNHYHFGPTIDASNLVIRFNLAPTAGYRDQVREDPLKPQLNFQDPI